MNNLDLQPEGCVIQSTVKTQNQVRKSIRQPKSMIYKSENSKYIWKCNKSC